MKNLIRVYDNGGETLDRYTVVYLKDIERKIGQRYLYSARGMSGSPFSPQGFGCYTSAMLGRHLGQEISFNELPKDCQKLVLQDLNLEGVN